MKFADESDLVILGLTPEEGETKEIEKQIRTYLKHHGVTWPNGYGAQPMLDELGVRAFPTIVVAGRDGKIAWAGHFPTGIEPAIKKALAAPK